jgi:hypothetical protein
MHEPIVVDRRPGEREHHGIPTRALIGAGAALLLIVAAAIWFWLGREPALPPTPTVEVTPPPPPAAIAAPTPRPPEPAPVATPVAPLPALDASDDELAGALTEALGAQVFAQTLRPDDLARRLVLTIDSLPRRTLSLERRIVQPMRGAFAVRATEDEIYISNDNFLRYSAFVTLVSRTDARLVVELYRRYYPLLQEAYLELGNADTVFETRVFEVINHLLEAPEIDGPVALTQPNVLYEFADPALEARSSGHKILIRMGPINSAIVKAKLREIRTLLTR